MDGETGKEDESILEEGPESSETEDSTGTGVSGGSGGASGRVQQPALYIALGLVLLAGLALLIVGFTLGGGSKPTVSIPSPVALQTPGVQVDPKLASVLTDLQGVYLREGEAKAREFAISSQLMDVTGRVNLTLDLDTTDTAAQDELVAQLTALGVKIDNRFSKSMDISFTLEQLGKALEIPTVGAGTPIALPTTIDPNQLPPTLLQKLADLKHVARVRLPREPSPLGEFSIPQLDGP